MEYNNQPEKQIFNMSLSILERVNQIINLCAEAQYRTDFVSWFKALDLLGQQISYLFSKDERNQDNYYRTFIYEELPEFESKMYRNKDGNSNLRAGEKYENYGFLLTLLKGYQDFLLSCFDNRDMMGSKKADKTRAVGEM